MKLIFCILISVITMGAGGLVSCGGNDSHADLGSGGVETASATDVPSATAPVRNAIAPSGGEEEIVPLLQPIPPGLAEDRVLPEDPAAFRRRVIETLKEDPSAEVLSMIDVVLLLDPHDDEMREIRGKILLKQGFPEDAAVDLEQCCKGGRSSCCR